MPPENSAQFRWFAANLRPHESMLRAWLRTQFPSVGDLDDIVQESYARVLHAQESQAIDAPKAFLFATARNLALMQLRQRQAHRTDSLAEIDGPGILDESSDVAETVARAQELELLTQAIQTLPARCRQILTLRKIYGMSQREVAAELGIAEHTVEAQGTIALRKLTEFFERVEKSRGHR
jgi:RNA polymerase sigma factor (sigma-70 family)